jgi:hypothetical protein
MAGEMKIHRVIEGPYESEDEDTVWCLCLVEENGELYDIELFFDTFEEGYSFKAHFQKSIEPIILNPGSTDHDA